MHVIRSSSNPIIRPHMDDRMGDNVNGPSLIRVPDWIAAPLGRYYLYFAHHDGNFIRLAYADDIEGQWTMHRPGVLPQRKHASSVTSPRRMCMSIMHSVEYVCISMVRISRSAPGRGPQYSRLAVLSDGLQFQCGGESNT